MSNTITTVTLEEQTTPYTQHIKTARHALMADEPLDLGGADLGPAPYEILLASLGACTSMTIRMYAKQKQWPLQQVKITLTHEKRLNTENKKFDHFMREITLLGNLDDAQRARLIEIADKCPVHKTLIEEPRPVMMTTLV